MLKQATKASIPTPALITPETRCSPGNVHLDAAKGLQAAQLRELPRNFRMTAEIAGFSGVGVFGRRIRRGNDSAHEGYDLRLDPAEKTVHLNTQVITRVGGLQHPIHLDLTVVESVIDLCIDNRRCIIDRCPEQHGDDLLFYAWDATATFNNIRVTAL
jgi:beta-fructofuranosidase